MKVTKEYIDSLLNESKLLREEYLQVLEKIKIEYAKGDLSENETYFKLRNTRDTLVKKQEKIDSKLDEIFNSVG